MTKTDTRDVNATVSQIKELENAGCELVRMAVPDMTAAKAVRIIKQAVTVPLIADIHFDHRLALESIYNGIDGLRINPGNIGDHKKVSQIVKAARENRIPIRIGVNAGSLPANIDNSLPAARRMVIAAMSQVEFLEKMDFDLIKLSLKAFDIPTTIEAYREIAGITPYPLHLGITEAGVPPAGIIRSTAGVAPLLYEGIGDTIRVSLTADPVDEVNTAYEILKSLNLRQHGPVLISCPTCGRIELNVIQIAKEVEAKLRSVNKNIKVAVMGCAVNGPGEAREADIGIAGGKGKAILFKNGQKVRVIKEADIVSDLMAEIEKMP